MSRRLRIYYENAGKKQRDNPCFKSSVFRRKAFKFLMAVVGTRLDIDVSNEFLKEIKRTFPYNTHLVFAGYFEKYEKRSAEVTWLKEHSTNVGYQGDIMAFMETIDLYVNPKRLGGGFSIIEAFF